LHFELREKVAQFPAKIYPQIKGAKVNGYRNYRLERSVKVFLNVVSWHFGASAADLSEQINGMR